MGEYWQYPPTSRVQPAKAGGPDALTIAPMSTIALYRIMWIVDVRSLFTSISDIGHQCCQADNIGVKNSVRCKIFQIEH